MGPPSRCPQALREIAVELRSVTPATTFRIRPGQTRTLDVQRDLDRFHMRLFDTPRSCGPADGPGELRADFVIWRSFRDGP